MAVILILVPSPVICSIFKDSSQELELKNLILKMSNIYYPVSVVFNL